MNVLTQFKKTYIPLNTIEVSKEALLHNYSYLSNLDKMIQIAPVLKSNAYGHGIEIVAKILEIVRPPFFCVDSIYEAYSLVTAKVKTPILITGYVHPHNLQVKKLPFSYAVYDRSQLDAIKKYQPHAGIHIFVETGLHREGVTIDQLPSFLDAANGLRIEGVMSHLAAGDNHETTRKQLLEFEKAKQIMEDKKITPKWFHIAATSGLLNHTFYKGKLGNLTRVGIGSYGFDPENKNTNLKPALQFKTTLCQVKQIKRGDKVGYDHTLTAKKDMTIGILAAGYNDGIDRRLSNRGVVIIQGVFCPIIGRVSMNITTIDISKVKNPKVGDPVIVFSSKPADTNAIAKAATQSDTIAYDLVVRLASTTKRIIV